MILKKKLLKGNKKKFVKKKKKKTRKKKLIKLHVKIYTEMILKIVQKKKNTQKHFVHCRGNIILITIELR